MKINKLPLELRYIIHDFYLNNLGFNIYDLMNINREKEKNINKFMKLRLKLELSIWYESGTSVYWLKSGGVYGKKNPNSVYGGGSSAESQYLKYYTGVSCFEPIINVPKNSYIKDNIQKGDLKRIFI